MKGAAPNTPGELAVVLLCLRHGPLRQDNGISVQVSIEFADTVQRRFGNL